MDKYYSRNALVFKAVYCVILAPLYNLLSSFITIEDNIAYVFVSIIPIGCLYTIPFWLSLNYIKKYRVEKIKRYVLLDLVFCVAAASLGVLFWEICYTIATANVQGAGLPTLIFAVVFIMIASVFWILYLLFSKIK